MKSWLKFYFLSFFSHKLSAEAPKRSFWNAALSILLTFVILTTGLFTGFAASFGSHYKNASDFRDFLYGAFASEEGKRINLSITEGKLSADIPDGDYVNGFLEGNGAYGKNGYNLIVDTRPAATTYDDFSIVCKDGAGNEISYEDYFLLPESERNKYIAYMEYSGKTLDVTAGLSEYESYLEDKGNSSVNIKTEFESLKTDYAFGKISETEYARRVYVLYARNYYPSYKSEEQYGEAPTVRTYYLGMVTSEFSESFLMLLDGFCVGSFKTDKGVSVDFEGYYPKGTSSVVADGMSEQELRSNVDSFILQCFKGSGGYNYLIYLLNMFKPLSVILIILLVLAIIGFIICRYKFPQSGVGYTGVFKLISSYMLIASVMSFLVAVVLSFSSPKNTVFLITLISFVFIVTVRSAIHLIRQILAKRKSDAEQAAKQNNS